MIKKVVLTIVISMMTTIILALGILTFVSINSSGSKGYTIVTGKVVAKADFDLKVEDGKKKDNKLFIVFKVDDKYIKLNANVTMFNGVKIGDKVELKRIVYKPKIGEEQIYYDYN